MPLTRRIGSAALAVLLAAPALVATAAHATNPPPDYARGVGIAAAYAKVHHVATGIAVFDTETGEIWSAGNPSQNFISASVVKTMIATRLMLDHEMTGSNASLAWKMITQSDNNAANALYAKVGRDTLLPDLEKHYDLPAFGRAPTSAGHWGTTRITAGGMVRFYNAVRHDAHVWPWLSKAMHAWAKKSSAGEPNDWGLGSVAPKSAVKNGWDLGVDAAHPSDSQFNTTGFLPGDRYAVAILTEGAGSLYLSRGEAIVTGEAYRVYHHGNTPPVPPKPATVATVVLDPGHNGGNGSHIAQITRLVNAGYGERKACNTTGTATNAGYPEHAFTWSVATQVKQMLAVHHVKVIMTRSNDTGVGPCVDQRAHIETTAGVTAAIAIHADGSADSNHGFHLCVDSRRPVYATAATVYRTTQLNKALHTSLAKYSGIGVANYVGSAGYYHRDDLAGLNLSSKPTAFLEIGNMRNPGDAAKQSSKAGRTRIAQAVTLGILAYLDTFAT